MCLEERGRGTHLEKTSHSAEQTLLKLQASPGREMVTAVSHFWLHNCLLQHDPLEAFPFLPVLLGEFCEARDAR